MKKNAQSYIVEISLEVHPALAAFEGSISRELSSNEEAFQHGAVISPHTADQLCLE